MGTLVAPVDREPLGAHARKVAVVAGVVTPAHDEELVVVRTFGRLVVKEPVPHDCVVVMDDASNGGHALARAVAVLDQQS